MKTLFRILAIGCLLWGATLSCWAQKTIREEKTFTVSSMPTVVVSDISGNVKIVGDKSSQVRIIAEKQDPKIEILMEQVANRVRVEVKYPQRSEGISGWFGASGFSNGDVNLQISMPEAGNLEARTVSGDISAEKLQGDLLLKAVSGDLKLTQLEKRITADTVSGDIQINQSRGEFQLKTVSGDVVAQNLEGRLTTRSVSGDLHVRSSNLSFIAADSTSGDVEIATPLASGGSYSLNTHSGEITLNISKNSSFRLAAETFSGEFRSDFTIPSSESQEKRRGRHITATIGSGDSDLRLRTFSGDVRLVAQ